MTAPFPEDGRVSAGNDDMARMLRALAPTIGRWRLRGMTPLVITSDLRHISGERLDIALEQLELGPDRPQLE